MAGLFRMGSGFGMDVGQGGLRFAEVRESGGVKTLMALDDVSFRHDLLVESFTEPNIVDVPGFIKAVREIAGKGGRIRKAVNVALPDTVARVVIHEFDTLQQKAEETESMLKWRFKKLVPFNVDKAALRYQYLGAFRGESGQKHRFIASLMKSDVLQQYENVLHEAGLRPRRIDVSSFAVWNLYHDYLMKQSGQEKPLGLLNVAGTRITVMVFERGVIRFMRQKDLGANGVPASGHASLLRELHASLTYYKENYSDSPVAQLAIAGDMDDADALAREVTSKTGITSNALALTDALSSGALSLMSDKGLRYSAACGAAGW